ncbi:MAG: hypothetical protein ACKKL6_03550 [Candidatus Komeilibacteria bacterium]
MGFEGLKLDNLEEPKQEKKIVVRKKIIRKELPLPDGEKFRVIKGKYNCEHPILVNDSRIPLRADDIIKVSWSVEHNDLEITVADYLALIDRTFQDYADVKFNRRNKGMSNQEIFYSLHQETVNKRGETSKHLTEKFNFVSPDKGNNGIESRDHDSKVFVKGIRELGIEGVNAVESRPREDYLDQIDEFIVIDTDRLAGKEESDPANIVHLAIQRSANEDPGKKSSIIHKPVVTIPDRLEYGHVPRFFLQEKASDYGRDDVTGDPIDFRKMMDLTDKTKPLEKTMGKEKYNAWIINIFSTGVKELTEYLENSKVKISEREERSIVRARDAMQEVLDKIKEKE